MWITFIIISLSLGLGTTKFWTSTHHALGLLLLARNIGGQTQKTLLQLCARKCGHDLEQMFCSWFPIFYAKSKRLRAKTFPWPHFEFLSFVLRVLSMAKIKIFYSWPPTFGIESRRPNTKKHCSNSMHAYLGMV
jgi:hypothetical protein